MSATNSTIDSLYAELETLEKKIQETDISYSLEDKLEEFNCGITEELILDPVVAADGITYERRWITGWLEKNDTSPTSGVSLKNKDVTDNVDFRRRLIKRLEKEKRELTSRLSATGTDADTKKSPTASPEANKLEAQENQLILSSKAPSSSSAVLSSQVDSVPVLTPVSKEKPLPAPAFFSSASHSASHSSSSVPPSVQTVSLNNENDVWQRCLELRNHLRSRFLADTTDIAERFIVDAEEAKQQYVNLISYVEEQIEHTGEMTSAEIELIRRALVPMTEYEISIPDGRVIDPDHILQISFEISEFSAEVDEEAQAAVAVMPVSVAPMHEGLPPPLTVSTPVLNPESEFPLMRSGPSLSSSVASSSLLSSFYVEPDDARIIRLTESDIWQRCLELKNLLALPADNGRTKKADFFNGKKSKEKYVKIISFIEEKKQQGNAVIVYADVQLISDSLKDISKMINVSTEDGRFIYSDDIRKLWSDIYSLCAASDEQIEHYTQLIGMQFKLEQLLILMEAYKGQYRALLNNISSLHDEISDKIDEYKMKHPRLAASREIILPQPFPGNLPVEEALNSLMHLLGMQIDSELPANNKNSHIFTPGYERIGDKFESTPFSPCSREDTAVSPGLTLFSADKIDTSGLQKELDMLGIPAKITHSGIHRFRHEDSIVGGVRIVFDCADPVIFNIAIELQRIRYQHAPRSIIAQSSEAEPSIVRSSLLSSSFLSRNSDAGANSSPSSSSSSRASRSG